MLQLDKRKAKEDVVLLRSQLNIVLLSREEVLKRVASCPYLLEDEFQS